MSESLREQMLKAGFKEAPSNNKKKQSGKPTKPKHKSSKKRVQNTGPSSMERANIAEREAIAERKRIKAEIKTIIEAEKIDDTKGESAHSYVIGKRIKQMFVSEAIREKLVDGSLVITRLNGSTFLIPTETGERVRALNPDWVIIGPGDEQTSDIEDEYADYQVPDDLKW